MKTALVITSISAPNKVLKAFAKGCSSHDWDFVLIGDKASPSNFKLNNCHYFGLSDQRHLPFRLAKSLPANHYSRKNLGYLQAIKNGSNIIVESDDDNMPLQTFWKERTQKINCDWLHTNKWVNVYSYFTKKQVWPRGFPLDEITIKPNTLKTKKINLKNCPIQQGLSNGDPDVDAIYRLSNNANIIFNSALKHLALGKNTWCPFNSQNTTWFRDAFPLLYLPSHCNFRVTDIWRSFVAQRLCWENGWAVDFHYPNVSQKRNYHNLMKDFEGELVGYLNNRTICQKLENLQLKGGKQNLEEDMLQCYKLFISLNLIPKSELKLLRDWFNDLNPLL